MRREAFLFGRMQAPSQSPATPEAELRFFWFAMVRAVVSSQARSRNPALLRSRFISSALTRKLSAGESAQNTGK